MSAYLSRPHAGRSLFTRHPSQQIPDQAHRPETLARHLGGVGIVATLALALMVPLAVACTPRVALEAPKEPITINLNVKIDHEIRLKVEKDIDDLFSEDSELF